LVIICLCSVAIVFAVWAWYQETGVAVRTLARPALQTRSTMQFVAVWAEEIKLPIFVLGRSIGWFQGCVRQGGGLGGVGHRIYGIRHHEGGLASRALTRFADTLL
jgi:hypothetical protein